MDGAQLVEDVEDAKRTELDRLGSEKALIAATGASLETEDVLAAAAAMKGRARDTFDAWADDETDEHAREAFAAAAERESADFDRIVERMSGEPTVGPDAVHEHLRDLDETVARVAAGTVALPLTDARALLQVVNFFVNEADRANADLFREVRADAETLVDDGTSLLDDVCEGDDWERAREAANATVQVAYDEYATVLREMGLDPKPVC